MPVYEYEHVGRKCARGKRFELRQGIDSERLALCPDCGGAVRRVISAAFVNTPRTNSDLKGMGFTKLVRRDKGVYENVTATGGESRLWDVNKPDTKPNLRTKIRD
jgi:putative FmdB family regulatory protein